MTTRDLHEMTAAALSAGFAARKVSPVDVATALLDRIAAHDGKLNAFCLVDRETSLAQARASARRWEAGKPLSPLDGVPVAVKDLLLTNGWPTLRGSLTVDAGGPWDVDAPAVARLRKPGRC